MRDPRDIVIRPVVSEKSYASYDENVYTFVVADDANKIEIRQAIEAIFNVKVTNVNTLNRSRQAQAQPAHRWLGPARRPEAGDRLPRRGRHASRSSGADDADPQAQAHQPRTPVPDRLRLLGDHHATARRSRSRSRSRKTGWPQLLRPHDVAAPRRRSQAEVPRRRLPSREGRRAREGRGRSSTTRTATRASRCSTTSTARSATSSPRTVSRSATCSRAGTAPRSAPATRCRCATSRSGPTVHNVELKPGAGGKLGRGAGAAIQLVAKEGMFATLRLPSTEMRRVPDRLPGDDRRSRQRRGVARQDRQGGPQPLEGQAPAHPRCRHEPGRPPARRWRGQELRWAPPGVAVGQARGPHPPQGQEVRRADHPPPPRPRQSA